MSPAGRLPRRVPVALQRNLVHQWSRLKALLVRKYSSNRDFSTDKLSTNNNNGGGGTADRSRVALIMGVTNQRSIAWSCLQRFLLDGNSGTDHRPWKILLTCQNDKIRTKVESMVRGASTDNGRAVIGTFSCDVTDPTSMQSFFQEALPEVLMTEKLFVDAVVHSIAFAPNLKTHSLLETTAEDFAIAHAVSAYSLVDVARQVFPHLACHKEYERNGSTSSITTLSYLGAERAIPGYNVMGPAKASLESIVRGLALELGAGNQNHQGEKPRRRHGVRVNAVRAGPIPTVSSKGGIADFQDMLQDVEDRAPLGRNVTSTEVAATVYHVAAEASGLTGQTIDVDGGYSIVAGPIHRQ